MMSPYKRKHRHVDMNICIIWENFYDEITYLIIYDEVTYLVIITYISLCTLSDYCIFDEII